MRGKCFFLFVPALLWSVCTGAQITVNDADDGAAVSFASVYNADGKLLGMTDLNGLLPAQAEHDGPISIYHMNYGSVEVLPDTVHYARVSIRRHVYATPETPAKPEKKDIVKLSVYVRQYHIADGMPASYQDGVYDFYFLDGKENARRKIRHMRSLFRKDILEDKKALPAFTDPLPDMKRSPDVLTEGILASLNGGSEVEKKLYKNGSCIGLLRVDRQQRIYEAVIDSAYAGLPVQVNVLGVHLRIANAIAGETFSMTDGNPDIKDLLRKHLYLQNFIRLHGKDNPETKDEQFTETYVLSAGYVDKDTMKADMKTDQAADFVMPDGVPALPASFDKDIGRMVEKD